MFSQLDEIERKYEEISNLLALPSTINDPNKMKALSKERAELEELVHAYREYKKTRKELEESKELIATENDDEIRTLAKEELRQLETKLAELENRLKLLLIPKDPNDEKNVILEIRAGTGGEEAALFVADVFRMYTKYAESQGWKIELTDANETGIGGFKEVIAIISGTGVYSNMKYESGVHRVQRVPRTEASGRIHTSAITVAVLPEADEIEVNVDEKDLKVDVFRASGPGGQGVNTTDSAVRITHIPTGIVVVCRDERSQHKNKAKALKILRARLYKKVKEEQELKIHSERRSKVGTGDRSEKIRTYNFPQNRVTDHRIGYTSHNLAAIMDGNLHELIDALKSHYQMEELKKGRSQDVNQ